MRSLPPILLLLAAGLLPASAFAQGSSPSATGAAPPAQRCSSPEHRQFDFWVGSWSVTGPNGRSAGTNHIERALDGCALIERWSGTSGSDGTSLNYYDAGERAWFQSWIDDEGQPLRLRGGLRDGRMVLEAEAADSGRIVVQRITWTPLDGDRVRQHWERSDDGRRTWTTVFDGQYTREGGGAP